MSWVKIDDNFASHPKIVAAGPMAGWLYICGLTYSARYLTDGFIPAKQVRLLADIESPATVAAKLVECGLWEPVDGGYMIHDYLKYNPSGVQVKRDREAAAARQAAWRERNAQPTDEQTPDGRGSNGEVTPLVPEKFSFPVPVPVPVPNPVKTMAAEKPAAESMPDILDGLRVESEGFLDGLQAEKSKPSAAEPIAAPTPARKGGRTFPEATNIYVTKVRAAYPEDKKLWPNTAQVESIENTVIDPPLFEKVVDFWVGRGWNPRNVIGMLEMYLDGGPKSNGKKQKSDEPAGYAGIREFLKEQGLDGGL